MAENVFVKYVPHGVHEESFKRLTEQEDVDRLTAMKKRMFGEHTAEFVVMYNNRNIRRKMTGDVILAFREFVLSLSEEKRKTCWLLLHTQPVDDNGTDLPALIRDCAPEIQVVFSADRVDTKMLNDIYNVADVVINMASNEGFGLGTLEALMAERMIVVNVTGGLQDQCGFMDEDDNLLHEDVHFGQGWGSNHDKRYTKHGEWVVPVFPNNRALIGSPPTPYIFDDRCTWEDAGKALREIYDLPPEERVRRGALGRQYCLDHAFTAKAMCQRFCDGFDEVFEKWQRRERFEVFKA